MALVGKPDTAIGAEADEALVYALARPLQPAAGRRHDVRAASGARLEGDQAAAGVLDALAGIPAEVGAAVPQHARRASRELARELACRRS